jgi:hypothetical protein
MKTALLTVTLDLRVYDIDAFVRAARKQALIEGVDPEDVEGVYHAGDLVACACMLLDPGVVGEGDTGSEILGSGAAPASDLL